MCFLASWLFSTCAMADHGPTHTFGPPASIEPARIEPATTADVVTAQPRRAPRPPDRAVRARVVRVTDGDTVVLSGIGVGEVDRATGGRKSRLIGINTPEVSGPVECFGEQASAFTRRAPDGEAVLVDFDVDRTDQYGRALVYVWHPDGRFFNARLAQEGFAWQATFPPNVRYVEVFAEAVRDARERDRGLWSRC